MLPRHPPRLLSRLLPLVLPVLALAAVPSCGGGGGDATAKFSGAWTFASGQLAPVCLGSPLSPFDLAGLNVTFAKVDNATISLAINPACTVKFHVSGSHATVADGQTCTLDLGGALGTQSITIKKWTLALSGDHIDNDIEGAASICTAAGTAVLVRGTTDAGVDGRDDGGRDGASSRGDGAAREAAAVEAGGSDAGAALDAATDAEVGTDADGGADAGDTD